MWSRLELKTKAKEMLSKHYWKAFLVMLIATIVGGNGDTPNLDFNFKVSSNEIANLPFDLNLVSWMLPTIVGVAFLATILGVLFMAFVSNPIEVGKSRFFLDTYEKEDVDVGRIAYAYKANIMPIVKVMFMRSLFIFLWSLLLVIPGIIKSYAYKFVPYLLAENPDLDYNEALALSSDMTNGHKMDMFVLDLSFIGWYILGAIALGIGVLFVHPYREATYAGLYNTLKGEPKDYYYDEREY